MVLTVPLGLFFLMTIFWECETCMQDNSNLGPFVRACQSNMLPLHLDDGLRSWLLAAQRWHSRHVLQWHGEPASWQTEAKHLKTCHSRNC
jgi:hypothetical protein